MPFRRTVSAAVAGLVLAARGLVAQDPTAAPASALPPIRPLGKVTAASVDRLSAVSQVRALPDGRVLVNDNLGRKIALFDPALRSFTVVADTTSATANAYSSRAAGLIAYRGDSTLFVDPSSLSILVIDGKGQVARVMSVPRAQEAGALIGGPNGTPGFDAQGRLVYRGSPTIRLAGAGRGASAQSPGAPPAIPTAEFPDSVAVIRIDLASRKLDTAGFVKVAKQNISLGQSVDGRMSMSIILDPMPIVDDWAVTSDGRVAIVRGRDYRIDWVGADGAPSGSSKIPFAWRHLDDSAKVAFVDSARVAMERLREQAQRSQLNGGADITAFAGASGLGGLMDSFGGGGGAAVAAMAMGAQAGGLGGSRNSGGGGAGRGASGFQIPPVEFVSPTALPDYAPPFNAGSVRGDADGNVWIRTTNVYTGGSVYDVVNAKGQLTDRVLLPPGRVIAGFARSGIVYMGVRDGEGVRLEQATIR